MHEFTSKSRTTMASGRQAGYSEWIAVGAVVAGTLGAIVGARRCGAGGSRHVRSEVDRPDPATLTAPHGDKLWPARE